MMWSQLSQCSQLSQKPTVVAIATTIVAIWSTTNVVTATTIVAIFLKNFWPCKCICEADEGLFFQVYRAFLLVRQINETTVSNKLCFEIQKEWYGRVSLDRCWLAGQSHKINKRESSVIFSILVWVPRQGPEFEYCHGRTFFHELCNIM